jgi:predicted RNase H-like HicB family nuclease
MTEFTIVIEDAGSNYSAYVIGLDGCISTGKTVEEATDHMREAIEFHLEGMRLHGDKLPQQMPIVKTVQVAS